MSILTSSNEVTNEVTNMFCVVDREKNFTPIKSGFKSAAQANNWAKKKLPEALVCFWGIHKNYASKRYFIRMR